MSGRTTQLKYAEKGKCQRCGRRKPASASLCVGCLEAHNAATKELKDQLVAAGKCAWCASPNPSGFRTCDDCREKHNARRRG